MEQHTLIEENLQEVTGGKVNNGTAAGIGVGSFTTGAILTAGYLMLLRKPGAAGAVGQHVAEAMPQAVVRRSHSAPRPASPRVSSRDNISAVFSDLGHSPRDR